MISHLVDYLTHFSGPSAYMLVFFVLIACGLGLPIPEDVTLIAAGIFAYYGDVNFIGIIILSLIGVLAGDITIFYLGSTYGRKITKKWLFKRALSEERLKRVRLQLSRKSGKMLIFWARFTPGLRAPIFFTCGTLHVPFKTFLLLDGLAALISVPAIIGAVYYFGDYLDVVVKAIKRVEHTIVFAIVGVVFFLWVKRFFRKKVLSSNEIDDLTR